MGGGDGGGKEDSKGCVVVGEEGGIGRWEGGGVMVAVKNTTEGVVVVGEAYVLVAGWVWWWVRREVGGGDVAVKKTVKGVVVGDSGRG